MNSLPSGAAETALALLEAQGVASSAQLQQASGKSQPTVSRLLAGLSARGVVALGQGRGARYALVKPILGSLSGEQPIWRHDAHGAIERWGTLRWLAANHVHVAAASGAQWLVKDALPWFLTPLRLEGFLGRLQARSTHLAAHLGADPQRWSVEQQLYAAASRMHDGPGAFTLGGAEGAPALALAAPVPHDDAQRARAYDATAADVAAHLPAGSSAGGEQAKFLVDLSQRHGGQDHWCSLIVKFTPPLDTPFGERWHDLLHAEALALQTLEEAGEPVPKTRVLSSARRAYLEGVRFDRVGRHGRRHAVPLWAVHDAFYAGPKQHWVATCEALAAQRRLSPADVQRVRLWRGFGILIGNTDMHFGNLSLWADDPAAAQFELAPCYDMLPMAYRPEPARDDFGLTPLNLTRPVAFDSATWTQAAALAARCWERVAAHAPCSAPFRAVAAQNAERVRALAR